MKHILISLTVLLLFTACEKGGEGDPSSQLLSKVMVGDKIEQSFDYNEKGQLIKQNNFGMCTATPQDEFFYAYQNNRLDNIKSVIRGLYSSHSSMCDPTKGEHLQQSFTYDNDGRISKVTHPNSVVEYVYNQAGLIQKQIITGGANPQVYQYTYDNRGNVQKVTDPQGNVQVYEYDNKINPYYQNKIHGGVLTPYTMSPNNVVKGTGANLSFTRKFKYNLLDLPVEVLEDNGLTYTYVYK